MPTTLTVHPWPDPVIDTLGFDPRSIYVETFWLPTLGPTSVLLMRRIATAFAEAPYGMELDVAELSKALGLGYRDGNSTPLIRSFERLVQFDIATPTAEDTYAVRRNLPPVNRRHIRRLPSYLQTQHDDWVRASLEEARGGRLERDVEVVAVGLDGANAEHGRDDVERLLHDGVVLQAHLHQRVAQLHQRLQVLGVGLVNLVEQLDSLAPLLGGERLLRFVLELADVFHVQGLPWACSAASRTSR